MQASGHFFDFIFSMPVYWTTAVSGIFLLGYSLVASILGISPLFRFPARYTPIARIYDFTFSGLICLFGVWHLLRI